VITKGALDHCGMIDNNLFTKIKMNKSKSKLDPEKYAYLKAEAEAPYKVLRKFIYFAFGASGMIGAFIFLTQLIAGQNIQDNFPNFCLQIGVVALMIFLWRWEDRKKNYASKID
jgi:hypothetical protein